MLCSPPLQRWRGTSRRTPCFCTARRRSASAPVKSGADLWTCRKPNPAWCPFSPAIAACGTLLGRAWLPSSACMHLVSLRVDRGMAVQAFLWMSEKARVELGVKTANMSLSANNPCFGPKSVSSSPPASPQSPHQSVASQPLVSPAVSPQSVPPPKAGDLFGGSKTPALALSQSLHIPPHNCFDQRSR